MWFEACIGYLSATKEWAKLQGDDKLWERFWKQDAKIYNFIGKDNIFFHTLSWPGDPHGLWRFESPLRCAVQRVSQHPGAEAVDKPKLGCLGDRLPGTLRR